MSIKSRDVYSNKLFGAGQGKAVAARHLVEQCFCGLYSAPLRAAVGKRKSDNPCRCPQFTEKGAVVLGVSKDSVASHKKFEEKYGLAFTLLADPERKVIEVYDVWKEKKNYGKVSMGVVRTTYLIDEQGSLTQNIALFTKPFVFAF